MVDDHDVAFGRALPHLRDVTVAVLRTIIAQAGLRGGRHVVPRRRVFGQVAELGAVARLGGADPLVHHRDEVVRRRRRGAQLIEPVQAHVVGAALHVGRLEGHAQGIAQHRDVLEINLFLEVLGAGRDQHALPAQDRRHEIGERFTGARARLGQQDAAIGERVGHGEGHQALALTRLELIDRRSQRAIVRKRRFDRRPQARRSGYSGNFLHNCSTSAFTIPRAPVSSGAASARVMKPAM